MSSLTNEQKEKLKRLRDDPVFFVEEVLRADIRPWQRNYLHNFKDNKFTAVQSGHRVGKSTAIVWLMLWGLLFRNGIKIAVLGASQGHLDKTIWTSLKEWYKRLPDAFARVLTMNASEIYRESKDVAMAFIQVSNSDTGFQGIHADTVWIFFDEASSVDEVTYNAILGSVASRTGTGRLSLLGNPVRPIGVFYDACTKALGYKIQRVSNLEMVDPDYVEHIIQKHGRDSNEYKIRILGEFPEHSSQQLISRTAIMNATERMDIYEKVMSTDLPVIWGLDVARYGDDRCALAKRRASVLIDPVLFWSKKSLYETFQRLMLELQNTPDHLRPDVIYVDGIGLGAGFIDFGKQLNKYDVQIIEVNVAKSPANKDLYPRLRDELWVRAKEWVETNQVYIPLTNNHEFINELGMPEYSYDPNNRLKVDSKDDMKKKNGRSPDLADAFVLTFQHAINIRANRKPIGREKPFDTNLIPI